MLGLSPERGGGGGGVEEGQNLTEGDTPQSTQIRILGHLSDRGRHTLRVTEYTEYR